MVGDMGSSMPAAAGGHDRSRSHGRRGRVLTTLSRFPTDVDGSRSRTGPRLTSAYCFGVAPVLAGEQRPRCVSQVLLAEGRLVACLHLSPAVAAQGAKRVGTA